jgi:hypothetical protein
MVLDGTRSGIKSGTREGTRGGTRSGTLVGSLAADINARPRKTGQWTGWNLKGDKVNPVFTPSGDATFGDPVFGDPSFTGDYTYGPAELGGWVAVAGDNPQRCLIEGPGLDIEDLVDETTFDDVVGGATEYGTPVWGNTVPGAVSTTGPATLFVTYNAIKKQLTIVP